MKSVLLTGASEGIGLATAKLLSDKKYRVTLVARNEEKLQIVTGTLHGDGHDYLVADLSKIDDVNRVVAHLNKRHYDVLVNNAGSGLYGRFEEMPLQEQLQMIHLNVNALVILSHSYLKQAQDGDSLVNIASLLAHSSFPGSSVYAGTKGFVATFTESLWYEAKKRCVYVLSFNPGATHSKFHISAGGNDKAFPEIFMQQPEQVAREMVRALERRKNPRVVSGIVNRLMMFGARLISRRTMVNIMGKISPITH